MVQTVQQIRLERLKEFLAQECNGVTAELVRRSKKKQSYISDLLRGQKSFGEKAARDLEEKLGLAPLALDQQKPSVTGPGTQDQRPAPYRGTTQKRTADRIATKVRDLDEVAQRSIEQVIDAMLIIADPKYWKTMADFQKRTEDAKRRQPILPRAKAER